MLGDGPLSAQQANGRLAAELSEGEAVLRVAVSAGGLTLLGIVLLVFTVRWWRSTRPEPPVLGPLSVMGERAFRSVDDDARRSLLDEARPTRYDAADADGPSGQSPG